MRRDREFSTPWDPFGEHYRDMANESRMDPEKLKLRIMALKRLRDRMMGGGVSGSPKSIIYPPSMLGYREIEPNQRAQMRKRKG